MANIKNCLKKKNRILGMMDAEFTKSGSTTPVKSHMKNTTKGKPSPLKGRKRK